MTDGADVADIERRILRACKTIRALPDQEIRFFQYRSLWPIVSYATEEAYGYDKARLPRFRPTPTDVSDCLTALAWARVLAPREWKLVWWRSLGWSFRHMAARIGRSDETARQRYRDAVLCMWWEATGKNYGFAKLGKSGNFRREADNLGLSRLATG